MIYLSHEDGDCGLAVLKAPKRKNLPRADAKKSPAGKVTQEHVGRYSKTKQALWRRRDTKHGCPERHTTMASCLLQPPRLPRLKLATALGPI